METGLDFPFQKGRSCGLHWKPLSELREKPGPGFGVKSPFLSFCAETALGRCQQTASSCLRAGEGTRRDKAFSEVWDVSSPCTSP